MRIVAHTRRLGRRQRLHRREARVLAAVLLWYAERVSNMPPPPIDDLVAAGASPERAAEVHSAAVGASLEDRMSALLDLWEAGWLVFVQRPSGIGVEIAPPPAGSAAARRAARGERAASATRARRR
ncbi:MAG: hypothetical protein M5U28_27120 [Sandaracinaceae bacterium]|nr:hypothetical protein [Sandaracinaceae bacterium]